MTTDEPPILPVATLPAPFQDSGLRLLGCVFAVSSLAFPAALAELTQRLAERAKVVFPDAAVLYNFRWAYGEYGGLDGSADVYALPAEV